MHAAIAAVPVARRQSWLQTKPIPIFLIDSKEAAFVLGISSRTLANWRCKGRGPAYIRLGKKRSPVMYRLSDVQDWIVEHQVKASGDARR